MAEQRVTERLMLRTWRIEDGQAAPDVFGHVDVARWLSPNMGQVPDLPAMQLLLQQWIVEDTRAIPPAGRWCIQQQEDERVIGGAILLPLPPGNEDVVLSPRVTVRRRPWVDLLDTETIRPVLNKCIGAA